uniref:Uncharacterized protein n=1 Tax=Anguilla anguilla TaxID=7936 RepID=A0A0E9RZY3_ANGAN
MIEIYILTLTPASFLCFWMHNRKETNTELK